MGRTIIRQVSNSTVQYSSGEYEGSEVKKGW